MTEWRSSITPNVHTTIFTKAKYTLCNLVAYNLQIAMCVLQIAQLYVTYDVSYRIELHFIPYDVTKSYATYYSDFSSREL